MSIVAESITWKIGKKVIVDDVSFNVEPGQMVGLIGPNGCGKSSLLRVLAGLRRPHAGKVWLSGNDITSIPRKQLARRIAFVEQHGMTESNMQVRDVVKLGRIPHHTAFSSWTAMDDKAVDAALVKVEMIEKEIQGWQSLSGGERQRVHIARALAQSPTEILLDEPTNHLDIHHQLQLLKLISDLKMTSVVAIHDLNHASMFCDKLVVMQKGEIVSSGTPDDVINENILREVFGVETIVETSNLSGKKLIQYLV